MSKVFLSSWNAVFPFSSVLMIVFPSWTEQTSKQEFPVLWIICYNAMLWFTVNGSPAFLLVSTWPAAHLPGRDQFPVSHSSHITPCRYAILSFTLVCACSSQLSRWVYELVWGAKLHNAADIKEERSAVFANAVMQTLRYLAMWVLMPWQQYGLVSCCHWLAVPRTKWPPWSRSSAGSTVITAGELMDRNTVNTGSIQNKYWMLTRVQFSHWDTELLATAADNTEFPFWIELTTLKISSSVSHLNSF